MLQFNFDVIGLTETKIKKGLPPNFDISIEGYNSYQTPTEAEMGGAIMYIAKQLNCKPRKDL